MKQLSQIAAAAALAVAAFGAQAQNILVDDFNTPAAAATGGDTTVNGSAVVISNTALVGQTATNRLVENNLTQNTNNLAAPVQISVGGGATGDLNIQNGPNANSTVTVTWTMGAFALPPGPYAILFSILFSDNGVPNAVPNNAAFSFNGAGANDWNKNINFAEGGGAAFFDLSNQEATFLSGGGTLTMVLSGSAGWDLSLDQFSISIPEPTSLALTGLALLGAGFAARRRKA